MAITVETALLNNQSILRNFALGEEIDEQAAEIISGGKEFTVKNTTSRPIFHKLDNYYYLIRPGEERKYVSDPGIIEFDTDSRFFYLQPKYMELDDGKKYEFQDNITTPTNPYDIDLYPVP